MSHFTVMVIGDNPEDKLMPYEEKSVEKYVAFNKKELTEEAKKRRENYKNTIYAEYLKNPDEYKARHKSPEHIEYLEVEFPKKLQMTDEELYQDELKYFGKDMIGPNGEVYSTYNPLSKWDWYQLGGRWRGSLKVKENISKEKTVVGEAGVFNNKARPGYCDQAKLKYLDKEWLQGDKEKYNKGIRFWELIVEHAEPKSEEEKKIKEFPYYNKEYYIATYKDKETYAKCQSIFKTFAVITEDGEWYETGKMGWFGISSETPDERLDWELNFYDRFLKDLSDETLISIFDCHI